MSELDVRKPELVSEYVGIGVVRLMQEHSLISKSYPILQFCLLHSHSHVSRFISKLLPQELKHTFDGVTEGGVFRVELLEDSCVFALYLV